jgi:hypothetical protein
MKTRFFGFVCALMIGIACSAADAITIYSTFGEGDAFDTTNAAGSCNWIPQASEGASVAAGFTPDQDYTLDSVTLALKKVNSGPFMTISIRGDDSGKPATAVLVELIVTNPDNTVFSPQALTYSSTTHPTLSAGTTYWLAIEATGENNWEFNSWWMRNTTDVTGCATRTYSDGWGAWQVSANVTPAFRIEGSSAVPEPSTAAFFGMGLIGLIGAGWRRYAPRFKNRDCC